MAPSLGAVTVLIADTGEGRAMLADVLSGFDDFQVVGIASDAENAIDLAARHNPQVALLHVDVPGGGGVHATRGIRAVSPRTRVIALGAGEDHESVRSMLSAGARAHLPRHTGAHELLRSMRQFAAHAAPVGDGVKHSVVAEINGELQSRLGRDRLRDRKRGAVLELINAGGPEVVVQPIRRLVSSEVVGFEALSRFGGDRLTTAEWFDEAHSCGLGPELEIAALRAAVEQAWPLIAGRGDAYLAINVSPSTLGRPDALHLLGQLPADRVVVELTEHELITDSHHLSALARIRSAGIRIAIDDVGAGFAGLQRLLTLRPDIIKLDRGVVGTIETDPSRRALTRALAGFADELGIALVAEGIERWSQTLSLCELGVSLGQGYLLGPPEGPRV
ncbi:MAG TPA: EAL domain-containing protein [Mycobacteriales bacterium]|nr:EAL domain-containing protein [Mycobacteriales bacterium]